MTTSYGMPSIVGLEIIAFMIMTSILALLISLMSGVDNIQENAGVSSKGKVYIKGGQSKKMARKGHGYVCIFLAAITYVVLEVQFHGIWIHSNL